MSAPSLQEWLAEHVSNDPPEAPYFDGYNIDMAGVEHPADAAFFSALLGDFQASADKSWLQHMKGRGWIRVELLGATFLGCDAIHIWKQANEDGIVKPHPTLAEFRNADGTSFLVHAEGLAGYFRLRTRYIKPSLDYMYSHQAFLSPSGLVARGSRHDGRRGR